MGLSGGLDSVVLLHALVTLRHQERLQAPLLACHINHHLHADAPHWQEFCAALCARLEVPFTVREVFPGTAATGIEARARALRYTVFTELLATGDVLLLAHHLDDQLETLVLRLARGAGPSGLKGMPRDRSLGEGQLWRPLLPWSRSALQAYAHDHGLTWVDDASNADVRFDRNFCRHRLLPLVASRWPDYRQRWQKSQQLQADAAALLDERAGEDLDLCCHGPRQVLALPALLGLTPVRRRNLLRHWLHQLTGHEPGWSLIQRLAEELGPAAAAGEGTWHWDSLRLQIFRQALHALRELPDPTPVGVPWCPGAKPWLELPGNGRLWVKGEVIDPRAMGVLEVRYRQGGERSRLPGRPRKPVSRLLQEHGVPPWLRPRYPLLYSAGDLVCVPGIGVNVDHPLSDVVAGLQVFWNPPPALYGS